MWKVARREKDISGFGFCIFMLIIGIARGRNVICDVYVFVHIVNVTVEI